MDEKQAKEYLKVLDNPAVESREHFELACAATGLEVGADTFSSVVEYEASQLRNVRKIADMFEKDTELAVMTYKRLYRLVVSAGFRTDPDTLSKTFSVRYVRGSSVSDFNVSIELFEDAAMLNMPGFDADSEIWNMLNYEALKR